MKNKYYLVIVYGDVEPGIVGPFDTEDSRDDHAKLLRAEDGNDENGIYPLDINTKGEPDINAYSGAFFD